MLVSDLILEFDWLPAVLDGGKKGLAATWSMWDGSLIILMLV